MGIKGLSEFLKKKHPTVYKKSHLKEFAFKKIAIDVSLYLYKFKVTNPDYWLSPFIHLIRILRKNDVHCIFIYDGQAPIEKDKERQKRRKQRMDNSDSIKTLKNNLQTYKQTGTITPLLQELSDKLQQNRPLLLPTSELRIDRIEQEIQRRQNQVVYLTPSDIQLTKELFKILCIPFLQAIGEAETLASRMCNAGLVDAVMSEDTDVLVYGTKTMISKIDLLSGDIVVVDNNDLLEELLFNHNEFRDFCIMCGTDYNLNIPRVGPNKSYNLIRTYSSIDHLPYNFDCSILNHIKTRELFNPHLQQIVEDVPFCGKPNLSEFLEFTKKKRIFVDTKQLRNDFYRSKELQFL